MAERILILSASIGEGHDLPARMLADGLRAERAGVEAPVVDGLQAMGRVATLLAGTGSDFMFDRMNWLFDASYFLLARFAPTRAFCRWLTHRLGARGLSRAIVRERPDVIVSTYPGVTETLGYLRGHGRIAVPVVSAITDLAALHYWAHPDVDVHLITEAESEPEVRAIAPRTRVVCVRGLTDPAFERPVAPAAARAALGLPLEGPVIVVSGGGWAVGDLGGAALTALASDPAATVLALCGRSESVQRGLAARFPGEPRLRIMGFTDRMGDVLAAADVLVHSTAGLTMFEARIRGCRIVSYGWGVSHIRLNNAAYRRFGLAQVATTREQLAFALRAALAAPRRPITSYGTRPSAAEVVLGLAGDEQPAPAAGVAA